MTAVLVAFAAVTSSEANACRIKLPPLEERVEQVASEGVVIRGELVQAFDASKQQPEVIRADEVYIGDPGLENFVIYRSAHEFESRLDKTVIHISCGVDETAFKLGHEYDLLVLVPAFAPQDDAANRSWRYSRGSSSVLWGKGLEMLLAKSREQGRLQSVPPFGH